MKPRSNVWFTALAFGLLACAAARSSQAKRTSADEASPTVMKVGGAEIEIAKRALAFPKSTGRFEGWLGYALAKWLWNDSKFRERFPGESSYRSTFEEELDARESAAQIWGELSEKEHLTDPYFAGLHKVDSAGFLREYVWYCVPHPPWKQATGLRQQVFAKWLSERLPDHRVETWVSTYPAKSGVRVVLGVQPHQPTTCRFPSEPKAGSQ
jgi:hypothetical protein